MSTCWLSFDVELSISFDPLKQGVPRGGKTIEKYPRFPAVCTAWVTGVEISTQTQAEMIAAKREIIRVVLSSSPTISFTYNTYIHIIGVQLRSTVKLRLVGFHRMDLQN
jgi:hypothetical protein